MRSCANCRSERYCFTTHSVFLDSLEPCFFPEDHATCLTSSMILSITSSVLKVNRVCHPADTPAYDVVTRLVRALEYPELLPAKFKHFRHERQLFQFARFVQRCENFLLASNLHPVPGLEIQSAV